MERGPKFHIFDATADPKKALCLETTKFTEDMTAADLTPLVPRENQNKGYFIRMVKQGYAAGRLCASGPLPTDENAINSRFLNDALAETPVIVLLIEQVEKVSRRGVALQDVLRGFVLANPRSAENPRDLYINIICATRPAGEVSTPVFSGRTLLKFMNEYARVNNFTALSLSALPRVLSYYPKLGFEFRKSCRDPPVPVPERLLAKGVQLVGEDPYSDVNTPFRDFMLTLSEAGLEHDHDYSVEKDRGCKAVKDSRIPKEAKLSRMKDLGCENDGYYMAKCDIQPQIVDADVDGRRVRRRT